MDHRPLPPPPWAPAASPPPASRALVQVAWEIGWRDIRANRRLSVVMLARYLMQPLIQAGLFWMLLVGILRLDFAGAVRSYPSFVLAGLLAWGLVSTIVAGAMVCLPNNATLVRRVAFPRAALVYAIAVQGLVQLGVTALALAAVLLFVPAGRPPSSGMVLLWLFPLFAALFALSLALALFVASFSALLPNVALTTPVALQAWLYATPIIYPPAQAPPWLAATFAWNPLAVIVKDVRLVVLEGTAPDAVSLLYAAGLSAALLWTGHRFFQWCDPHLPDLV